MTVFNTIQGTSNTSFRVGLTGPTIYTGSADPTVTPPTPLADGFRDGDIYFRATTGGSAIWIIDNGGTWMQIASGAGGGSFAGDIQMQPGAQLLGDDAADDTAPAYAFDGDDDTGMFQGAANEIGFANGGVQSFIIESDGTLASTTASYEALVTSDNDIPNRKYVEDNFLNASGGITTGDLTIGAGTQIFLDNGTPTDPSIAFTGDTDSGFYLDVVGVIGVSVAGSEIADFNADGIQMINNAQFVGATSSASVPACSFNGDLDTGLFHDGSSGEVALSANGTETIRFDGTAADGILAWRGGDGTSGAPSISFSADTDTGFYSTGTGAIGYSSNTVNVFGIDATNVSATIPVRGFDGIVTNPAFAFTADPDTGIFRVATGEIGFASDGAETFRVTANGMQTVAGTAALPSWTFDSDPTTGAYSVGVGFFGISVSGVAQVSISNTAANFDQQVRINESNEGQTGPGFSWQGDTNTGMFNNVADTIGFSTGGVSKWTIEPTGEFLPSLDNTYDIGSSSFHVATVYATTFDGTATAAQYSDLAERYTVGNCCELNPGDVVVICDHDDHDICLASEEYDDRVLGVVSTAPAFMMNKDAGDDDTAPYIALRGRVPVKVCGDVRKGDLLIACGNDGCARALHHWEKYDVSPHAVFAKALSAHDGENGDGQIEAVIL